MITNQITEKHMLKLASSKTFYQTTDEAFNRYLAALCDVSLDRDVD